MEREDVIDLVKKQKYSDLLTCDQLVQEQSAGNVFQEFREGTINFAPTYKYDLFSDDYDTSEKCRVPAYCDRILFTRRKPGGTCPPRGWSDGDIVSYTRADLKQSDHRPVLAVFDVQYRDVDTRDRDRVIGDIVSSCGSYDGRVLVTPASELVFSPEITENIAKYLTHIGQIVQISQLREGIMICFDSVSKLHEIVDKTIVVGDIRWKVTNHCDNQTLTREESPLFGYEGQKGLEEIKVHRKSAPARPSAPPSRPSAPPAPRPSRPAPGVPPPISVNKLSLSEPVDNMSDNDDDGQVEEVKPPPTLASLDWPDDPPAVNLAPLTWPEPETESSEPPNLPPPSLPPPTTPPRLASLDEPPPFTPPSLHLELSQPPPFSPPVLSSCPPAQPPPPPPRVPARPAARLPPPVPKR